MNTSDTNPIPYPQVFSIPKLAKGSAKYGNPISLYVLYLLNDLFFSFNFYKKWNNTKKICINFSNIIYIFLKCLLDKQEQSFGIYFTFYI